MMILMAKVPSKLYDAANMHQPIVTVHAANDALLVLQGACRAPKVAINIVTTLSHRIMELNA